MSQHIRAIGIEYPPLPRRGTKYGDLSSAAARVICGHRNIGCDAPIIYEHRAVAAPEHVPGAVTIDRDIRTLVAVVVSDRETVGRDPELCRACVSRLAILDPPLGRRRTEDRNVLARITVKIKTRRAIGRLIDRDRHRADLDHAGSDEIGCVRKDVEHKRAVALLWRRRYLDPPRNGRALP